MNVGQRIKALRAKLGLSADDVADALGKDRSTVYRYESNDIEKLPTTILEPLAKVLKTTPGYLMGWTDNPTEENKPDNAELEENIIMYHRDGKTVKKKMSKEQMKMLSSMIDAIPDEDNPDL